VIEGGIGRVLVVFVGFETWDFDLYDEFVGSWRFLDIRDFIKDSGLANEDGFCL